MTVRLTTPEGSALDIADGRIVPATGRPALSIALGPGELRPGLINAHDHLHRNHYPRLGSPPYPDAYAWGNDLHRRYADQIARARTFPPRDALLFGALKNLLGGATTVVHHDFWDSAFDHGFPVRVVRLRTAHSLGFETELGLAARAEEHTGRPLCMHVAEGVNRQAADEVRLLAERGLLDRRLIAVHVVGVDEEGTRRLAGAGAAIVWCPTSNLFLFGRTAPADLFASGMDVLLGTDSLLTGAGTLLDELVAARRMGRLDNRRLIEAVGPTAARRLGVPVPSLAPGVAADLVHLRRPLPDAQPGDVSLVLVAGRPRLADESFARLFAHCNIATEPLTVRGHRMLVEAPLGTVAASAVALTPECGRVLA
ncbi:MAG TPA: amidohydrolase family protein [Gemmatimonadales bacterium]